jgi:glyoxylase-like metal-dependent hydrolase (beta-lactamase superfamily II)
MDVRRLADGLWRWTAGDAGCVYYEAPDGVVLIDPLLPAGEEERFLAYLDRDVERVGLPLSILLTDPRHERSAAFLRERYGADARIPHTVEAYPLDGGRIAYFIRPHRTLVVAALDLLPAAIGELPIALVLVSSPEPAPAPEAPGSSER